MIYTVNGEEVDYVKIDNTNDTVNIMYREKFNIITAHISRIEKRLKEKNINALVCKELYKRYIGVFLDHVEDYMSVVHTLNIPFNAYEVDRENNFLIILVDKFPKYKDMSYSELMEIVEDY